MINGLAEVIKYRVFLVFSVVFPLYYFGVLSARIAYADMSPNTDKQICNVIRGSPKTRSTHINPFPLTMERKGEALSLSEPAALPF